MKESPVFVKMFDLVAWIIPLTVKFPREQRFVVAAALQRVTLSAHESLIRAGHGGVPAATLAHLDDVAVQLALVRFYLRLSHTLALITVKQYEYAAERLSEIGRLVRAWQRVCQARDIQEAQGAITTSTTPAISAIPAISATSAVPGTSSV